MVKVVSQSQGYLRGGLTNQMMGMLGLLLVAQQHNATVRLPLWRNNYPKDSRVVTGTTSEVWGNLTWPARFPPIYDPGAFPNDEQPEEIVVIGFRVVFRSPHMQWKFPGHPYKLPLYTEVLNPRREIQAMVDEFVQQQLGPRFGALHARVERDMRLHRERLHEPELVVSLADILKLLNDSNLEKVDVLFVAVGDDLLPEDAAVLRSAVTPWGGRIVTSKGAPMSQLNYLDHSILDMAICAHSVYFVGARKSTFSEMLIHYKRPAKEIKLRQPFPSYYYNGNHTLPFNHSSN